MKVGIDLMGNDHSPLDLFTAIIQTAEVLSPKDELCLLANPQVIQSWHERYPSFFSSHISSRVSFIEAQEIIEMEESPSHAVRLKRHSSLVLGMQLLSTQKLDAFVSAGNTGALLLASLLFLNRLPHIEKPALLTLLPTRLGSVAVLDVGANVSCKALNLFQFAQMGVIYQRALQGISHPRVGLLNIGVEAQKGTLEVREAYQALQNYAREKSMNMDFVGNVEGREVFQGKVDVLVTDGFTGNVFLKTVEGISSFILEQAISALGEVSSGSLEKVIQGLHKKIDHAEYPGAVFCGVDGLVTKVHGEATPKAFFHGIMGAIQLHRQGFIAAMKEHLAHSLNERD